MKSGDINSFAISIKKSPHKNMHQLSLYVDGRDILEGYLNGGLKKYEWYIDDVMTWMKTHLHTILIETPYPLDYIKGSTAAELYKQSFPIEDDDINTIDDKLELVQDWLWDHSWVRENAGSHLAPVFFRRQGQNVEISWDNQAYIRKTKEGIQQIIYHYASGKKLVDALQFKMVIESICVLYFGK